MKSIKLLLAFCLSGLSSYCQNWKNTGIQDSGNYIFYNADDTSKVDVGTHKGVLKVWVKQKFIKHKLGGVIYRNGQELSLYFFDCQKRVWSINEIIYYDSNGNVIKIFPFDFSWEETPPGTQIAFLSGVICLRMYIAVEKDTKIQLKSIPLQRVINPSLCSQQRDTKCWTWRQITRSYYYTSRRA